VVARPPPPLPAHRGGTSPWEPHLPAHWHPPMPLHSIELQVSVKLRVDEPTFVQAASRCSLESVCCKSMFQVFQMFQRYVTRVSYGCCETRSRCCICCNSCTRMLQVSVLNVSSAFQMYIASVFIWILHLFHTCVTCVLSRCCIYFAMAFQAFSCVFTSVSDVCCKCFNCFECILQMFYLDVSKVDRVLHHNPTPHSNIGAHRVLAKKNPR
jgi:hypothetical protein